MKKIHGSYVEVINALQLPKAFYGVSKPLEYDNQVARDLARMCYVNLSGNVQGMQERLANRAHLADKDLSFTQGDFYAGIFTEASIRRSPAYFEASEKASKGELADGYYSSIGFHYNDDNGRQCGVSITYLRDDSDESIPLEKRSLRYALAVIKDVTKSPAQREVTYFTEPQFLECEVGQKIKKSTIPKELAQIIGSKSIAPLIKGLFESNGTINPAQFSALDARINANHNIDNRDEKLDKLLDIYIMWARLAADQQNSDAKNKLLVELSGIMINAFRDINYFKDKSVQDIEQLVATYKTDPLVVSTTSSPGFLEDYAISLGYVSFDELHREISQSFLRSNAGPLILIGVALAAVACVALTLTGILAPVGILAGVAVLASALTIYDNEQDREEKKEAVQSLMVTDRGFFRERYEQALASEALDNPGVAPHGIH